MNLKRNFPPPDVFLINNSYDSNVLKDSSCFFDRSAFIDDLVANKNDPVISILISTYSLKLSHVLNEFDAFLQKSTDIPILILHGDCSFANNSKHTNKINKTNTFLDCDKLINFPLLEVRQVEPQWKPNSLFDEFQVQFSVNSRIFGVHHPKYVLIFTKSGFYIIISTANMVQPTSLDCSWAQYFPRKSYDELIDISLNTNSKKLATNKIGADFGNCLQDFIFKQSLQIKYIHSSKTKCQDCCDTYDVDKNHRCRFQLFEWLKKNALIVSCFTETFDFSNAQVDLITTVPCRISLGPKPSDESRSRRCQECLKEASRISISNISYGLKRKKELILRHASLLSRELKPSDMLIVQPTSIGEKINNCYISYLLSCLLPEDNWKVQYDISKEHSWNLLWPTKDLIDHHCLVSNNSSRCLLFFNPQTLALMQPDIHARMACYQPNTAAAVADLCSKTPPHIKSYTRLMQSDCNKQEDEERQLKRQRTQSSAASAASELASASASASTIPDLAREPSVAATACCSCSPLAWFALTSACLSQGALGAETPPRRCLDCQHTRQGYIEYKNFEIGVMFHSCHVDADGDKDSLKDYRGLNRDCKLHSTAEAVAENHHSNSSIRILPVPYDLMDTTLYCEDAAEDDVGAFLHRPYFHCDDKVSQFNSQLRLP